MGEQTIIKLNKLIVTVGLICATALSIVSMVQSIMGVNGTTLMSALIKGTLYLGPMVVCYLIYKQNEANTKLKYCEMVAYIIMYAGIMASPFGRRLSATAFCILMVLYMYHDIKLIILATIGIGSINIVALSIRINTVGINKLELIGEAISHILIIGIFLVLLYMVTKFMSEENDLKIEEIQKEKETQEVLMHDVLRVAKLLNTNCEKVYDIVEQVSNASESVSNAVGQIAEGAVETANTIDNQLDITRNIQTQVTLTSKEFTEMKRVFEESKDYFKDGTTLVGALDEKAKVTNEISKATKDVMEEFKEKSKQINEIVEVITTISEQTNLLALNASIESARAGEAGKLAFQSKEATANITTIIKELQTRTEHVVQNVAELSEVAIEQGKLIIDTRKTFDKMIEIIGLLYGKTEGINQKMDVIVVGNNGIVEGIHDISAVSEETTASSEEVTTMAINSTRLSEEASRYVKELLDLGSELEKYF